MGIHRQIIMIEKIIQSERNDLFEPNVYITFLVEIKGSIASEEMMAAVNQAFTANESTMSRIVLEADGKAGYEQMKQTGCRVSIDSRDWETIIRQDEKVPFDISTGELMHVFLLSKDNGMRLLIRAHHLVGDGKSIVYFIGSVMRALDGEKLEFEPLQLIDPEKLPGKSKLMCLYGLIPRSYNKKWNKAPEVYTWKDYTNVHNTYWKNHSSHVATHTFTPDEVGRMRRRAKEMGVTLNSYIITAFLSANTDNHTAGMAVDIRPQKNHSMSNQASGTSVDYTYNENKSFEENAKAVHKGIYRKLSSPFMKHFILRFINKYEPTLLDGVLMSSQGLTKHPVALKLANLMGYMGGAKKQELGITNLTRLDIPDKYGTYQIEKITFIPPVVSYGKYIIGVATTGKGMVIAYHYMDEDTDKHLAFFDKGIQRMQKEG